MAAFAVLPLVGHALALPWHEACLADPAVRWRHCAIRWIWLGACLVMAAQRAALDLGTAHDAACAPAANIGDALRFVPALVIHSRMLYRAGWTRAALTRAGA